MTEVMDCFDFNQLQPHQSQDQCGFASVALCFAAGEPGKGTRQPVQWAIEKMAAWYTEYDGPNILSNQKGMETWQLYDLIVEKGGHYQVIDPNAASIASWIDAKYPVIVAVTEDSVYDVHLKAKPYTWDTSGLSHIFTVTGIDHGHIFLCRDTVNQHAGSPYSYDGDKLSYLSATVFVPDWLPRPTSAIAPQGGTSMSNLDNLLQHGWHYDSVKHELTAPNGVKVVLGFAQFMVDNQDPADWPLAPQEYKERLEDSNPLLGPGDQIICLKSMLGYPHNPQHPYEGLKNKVIVEYAGKELVTARQQVAKYYALAQDLQKQLQGGQPVPATDPLASQALAVVRQIKPLFQPF